ncbi:MAG: hypothetical protein QJR03_08355 [Sphaerobacter sp.]|nr:hypothetical protein [Sphaerobacter sp.]
MRGEHLDAACRSWLELAAQAREADDRDERLAQLIAEHLAACPDCAASEAALTSLIQRYRDAAQPPLSEQRERRLLDLLCGPASASLASRPQPDR